MSYAKLPSFVLGFHGCDQSLKEDLLLQRTKLKSSNNCYDWLGSGIYFWENDPDRALSWARSVVDNPKICKSSITTPAVVGAVIDLGFCLNLFDENHLKLVKLSYKILSSVEDKLPENKGKNLALRNLDCAVINALHKYREKMGSPAFDSVRAPFWEGDDLYPGAGFKDKNHIQICVRNPKCIKGYFDPLNNDM